VNDDHKHLAMLQQLRDHYQRDVKRRPRTLQRYGSLEITKELIASQTAEIERLERLLHV
jgi:hypothetical protein